MQVSLDRIAGCFLGQCLGDALGHPVEGHSSDDCLDYLHRQMKPLWSNRSVQLVHPFGQYTDDSQLARELLLSLVSFPEFDGDDFVSRLKPLFDKRLVVGPGIACLDAMRRISVGIPWQDAGCKPPQAGNGTAMRAAPVGMLYYDNPKEMIRIARAQGWVTHRDLRCDAGSIAIAGAVSLALREQVEPTGFCSQLADWMSGADEEFASYVRQLPKYLQESPAEVAAWARRAGKAADYNDNWPGISPFVVGTVLWSLYSFLKTPDDYFSSVWTSIGVGGDVDTTAAITGAISGAYNGRGSLPEHLLNKLHDHGEWKLRELDELCEKAFKKMSSRRV
jgi:ADP-ribosylglycohydrolase